jgi:Recombinase
MEKDSMSKIERIRELVTGSVDMDYVRSKTDAGWKLVAMEWRREIPGEEQEAVLVEEIPYGLRVAVDCSRLEEDPQERLVLVQMMELIVQDYSITLVASELNKRDLRTRSGSPWTPVSVFNMLPRLIEVGPSIFSTDDWEERKSRLLKLV